MAFIVTVMGSLVLLCGLQLLRTRYRTGLRKIPGPWIASFTNLWKITAVFRDDMPRWNIAVHGKYGPVVRIGPKHISFASPDAFSVIHSSRTGYSKSDFYEVGAPNYRGGPLENLFSIRDVGYHASLRRNIGHLYTRAAVQDFEPHIDRCTELFVKRMHDLTSRGFATVDMSLWLHLYAYDCLGEVNVSKRFGFMERGGDVDGMIAAANKIFTLVGISPFLHSLFNLLRALVPAEKAEPLLKYTFDEVNERVKYPDNKSDLLNKFLKLHEAQPDKLSVRELTAAVFINLMAGHDVLAITLRAVWYWLGHHERVATKLHAEIDAASKDLSADTPISYSQLSTLPYLNAVIQETLRFHPNTGTIIERKVPAEGAVIDGYALPGGAIVGVNAWVLHRDIGLFGNDAELYRPERWIEASRAQRTKMDKSLFTFGAGAHHCIGRNLALMQTYKVVAEFYRHFDAQLAHPEREWKVMGSWVTKQTEMDMIVAPLKEMA